MRKTGFGLIVALGLSVLPAAAGTVTFPPPGDAHPVSYTCDPSISAALCNQLNQTLGSEYADVFTNATANIYITMGNLPAAAVGHNDQFYTTVFYTDYYNALKASIHGPADAEAFASLPVPTGNNSNPINPGYQVSLTSALDAALGFSGAQGPKGICQPGLTCNPSGCTLGADTAQTCFNGIITLSNALLPNKMSLFDYSDSDGGSTNGQYDFFTVVQHETDEILGTGSCIKAGTQVLSGICNNGLWGISAADLFRYVGPGERGFSIDSSGKVTLPSTQAIFSIDGGETAIANLSSSKSSDDYGDLATNCQHVQDSIGCNAWPAGTNRRGMDLTTDGGTEIAMLDAIGYQLTGHGQEISAATPDYTPEPSSIGLVSIGFGVSGILRRRRRQLS
ncbi:MAG TPA: NF038122 family metalloprotease [Bryobacteraceae bacterium]